MDQKPAMRTRFSVPITGRPALKAGAGILGATATAALVFYGITTLIDIASNHGPRTAISDQKTVSPVPEPLFPDDRVKPQDLDPRHAPPDLDPDAPGTAEDAPREPLKGVGD